MYDKMDKDVRFNGITCFKSDLLVHKINKHGIYAFLRSVNFKKVFFEQYALNQSYSLKECIAFIKQHYRPSQNNYEVYKQAAIDLRNSYCLQLNNPKLKLRISWNKFENKILIRKKCKSN
jgi:hypothetical protein